MAEPKTTETQPPKVDAETGIAMAGEGGKYPLNHRLRAEALSKAGRKSDPDGLIDDALIVDAGERLAADAKAAAASAKSEATATPSK